MGGSSPLAEESRDEGYWQTLSPGEDLLPARHLVTVGGVPVINTMLKIFRTILQEKGLWPLK